MPHKNLKIITFEEKLLTAEELEEYRKNKEVDRAEAEYYRRMSENFEAYFALNDNPEDDIADDAYIWDEE